LTVVPVEPFTLRTARFAGRINGEAKSRGLTIPFADLLIGSTALDLGYAVITAIVRHFRMIPGLNIVEM
jgi:predicted nucleic acid-binding protein